MSLDLYQREIDEKIARTPKTMKPEPSMWDGFARGTASYAMQTFAKAGREVSMAAAAPVVGIETFTGGTELQDRFFRWHDDTFGEAVDSWTPRPGEVGVAGQITGQLLATLPMLIASPTATLAVTGLGVSEELVRKGVDPLPAIATGMIQAAGFGLGIYVPIIGVPLCR
jgi:hypothetical protein